MSTGTLLPQARAVFTYPTGAPLAAGYVYTYVPGGTTPKTTYKDAACTIANTNPIVLDAAGSCLLYGSGIAFGRSKGKEVYAPKCSCNDSSGFRW